MADPSSSSRTPLARDLSLTLQDTHSGVLPTLSRCRRRVSCAGTGGPSVCAMESRVLVINTGGTIGMTLHGDVLQPEKHTFVQNLRKLPMFHDEEYAKQTCLDDYYGENTFVLPLSKDKIRVVYTIIEYNPLLDSSNMTPKEWAKIGSDIQANYEDYAGFVILHGTDTMAYTASALSFMCEHLGKPVILTGSQVPIYEMRNDGIANMLGALLIAGQYVIPEVCLYFYNKLYRGNRVTKVDAGGFNAFSSPNLGPLATAEVDISINWDRVWRQGNIRKFQVWTTLNSNVGLLRLFPGITAESVRAFLQPPLKGVVLETYGAGNAPDNRPDLLEALKNATDSGMIIVNCTQCLRGTVVMTYNTGKVLMEKGLIAGGDMTPEASLTKLSYVLAKTHLDLEAKKKMMVENLRGEMSSDSICWLSSRFIQLIGKSLQISCSEEMQGIRDALTPTLACAAAKSGDMEALKALQDMGSNLSLGDYDRRTPLHIAASEGHLQVVEYLLSVGVTVHAKDRNGDTALANAVRFKNKEVVMLLRNAGAHFSRDELKEAGTELCSLAASGDLLALEIWGLAGADFSEQGYDGRTPLKVAEQAGKMELTTFFRAQQSSGGTASTPPGK
ncbi:60 kDa lysophospholipase [Aulostomus maculatus]